VRAASLCGARVAYGDAIVNAQDEAAQVRCPACRRPLVRLGSVESGMDEPDFRRRHAYWCRAGCRGPEPDGTFEFIECPACGSHDTVSTPRGNGVEEVGCGACGAITSVQIAL